VFREWQRAVNSRDSALVRAYVVAYEAERPEDPASVAESFDAVMNVVEQAGGIRVLQFRATSPERMDLLVQDARGMRLRMRLSVEEVAGAWRVAGIGLQPAEEGEALAPDPLPRRLPDQALADSLAARIDAQVARGRFDGSVLLARLDGTALLRRSWGTADRTRNLPITPETRFALASMGKMFTAIAMAQLVEQGRVALDSPIARYVPDYPNRDFATRATVRQLLNHTSGLGAYWGPEFERRRTQLLTPADHLPLFVNDSLPFAPGARFRYSNAGFQVLGLIVERVAGMSYYDYVQRNIFDRAGMRSSGYYPPGGETPEGVATGYTAGPTGALRDNNGIREVRGGPAGGGLSTVDDLLRFARALESGQLVRRETLAQWTSGQSDNGRYGFGFMAMQQGGSRAYGHNGGAPGMATWFLVYPDRQLVLIALTNRDPGLMEWVMQPVMGAMGS
jgi:CubicO group peptidase (beta-lactamase class C family)